MSTMEVSLATVAVSIIIFVLECWWNKKMHERSLKSQYLMNLFGELFFEELPCAKKNISFNGTTISGTEEIEKVLRELESRLIYLRSSNPTACNILSIEIQKLENHLKNNSGPSDVFSFVQFYNQVDEYIERIYGYINDMYLGKKIK